RRSSDLERRNAPWRRGGLQQALLARRRGGTAGAGLDADKHRWRSGLSRRGPGERALPPCRYSARASFRGADNETDAAVAERASLFQPRRTRSRKLPRSPRANRRADVFADGPAANPHRRAPRRRRHAIRFYGAAADRAAHPRAQSAASLWPRL